MVSETKDIPLDEMTMRDLAAMFAMMGMLAHGGVFNGSSPYWYADELLKARDEVPEV
jgi:hypothetical protein